MVCETKTLKIESVWDLTNDNYSYTRTSHVMTHALVEFQEPPLVHKCDMTPIVTLIHECDETYDTVRQPWERRACTNAGKLCLCASHAHWTNSGPTHVYREARESRRRARIWWQALPVAAHRHQTQRRTSIEPPPFSCGSWRDTQWASHVSKLSDQHP